MDQPITAPSILDLLTIEAYREAMMAMTLRALSLPREVIDQPRPQGDRNAAETPASGGATRAVRVLLTGEVPSGFSRSTECV